MSTGNITPVILCGYGKMGREIELLAKEKSIPVIGIADSFLEMELLAKSVSEPSVVIDFTEPQSFIDNISLYTRYGKSCVCGTTGWLNELGSVRTLVEESGIGLVYGSNFSPGVQAFFKIAELYSKILDTIGGYDAAIHEVHHKHKKDFPSGTANTLADIVLHNSRRKKRFITVADAYPPQPDDIVLSVSRMVGVVGEHELRSDSENDSLILSHKAYNRRGFALGALASSQWIGSYKGTFDFKDFFEEILEVQ